MVAFRGSVARPAKFVLIELLIGLVAIESALHAESGTRSRTLGFDVSAQGDRVDLLLTVEEEGELALRYQRSLDGGRTWEKARRLSLDSHPVHPPSPGSEPQIEVSGKRVLVVWTTPGTSRWGSGPLVGAFSDDSGQTWIATPSPATTGSTDSHGEVDLMVDSRDRVLVVWLDNRAGKRGLHAAVSHDFGRSWQAEETIDPTTCTCCWNRLIGGAESSGDPVYVIYRDAEPRDLTVARSQDGGWQVLGRPAAFDWQFEGCPSVGGALAWTESHSGRWLHALVWTGQEKIAGLYSSRSADLGASWSAPIRVGQERARRSDLAARGDRLVAVWDALTDSENGVFVAYSSDHGRTWSSPERLSETGTQASRPRIVALERGFRVIWLERHSDPDWQSAFYVPTP